MSRRHTVEQNWIIAAAKADLLRENAETEEREEHSKVGSWRDSAVPPPPRYVLPGNILTQYGTTEYFREQPRFEKFKDPMKFEVALSMQLGIKTVDEIARSVTNRPSTAKSRARYFETDDLYLHGYVVLHTPQWRNPDHVSVYFRQETAIFEMDEQIRRARANWAERGRVTLESLAITLDEARAL